MEQAIRVSKEAHIVILIIHANTVFPFQHHVIDDKEKINVTKI